jgi:large subunit ribosomal protein L41
MSVISLFIKPFLCARFAPRSGYTALTSKRGNKNFYKGKGAAPTGHHTTKGGYRILNWKLPDYVVPDLTNFEVRGKHNRGLLWVSSRQ